MQFHAEKFERAEMAPRRKRVAVEALSDFFDGLAETEVDGQMVKEVPMWEVRGLSATELHQAIEAGKRQSSIDAIVKAIAANADVTQAVRKALGLSGDTPGEIAKRLEMLVLGSVAPKIELPIAVKLATHFPIEFMLLTNEVSVLTGQGSDLVKPAAASQTTPA